VTSSLSVFECVTVQALIRPLQALCNYQLCRGAVPHHSRQHMIDSGLFVRQQSKRSTKRQCREFHCRETSEHATPCSPTSQS